MHLNNLFPLSEKEYIKIINRFKDAYEDIKVNEIKNNDCIISDTHCKVTGSYDIVLVSVLEEIKLSGSWIVDFEFDDFVFWEIYHVHIDGINF